jgi:RHS repeat-associated protein
MQPDSSPKQQSSVPSGQTPSQAAAGANRQSNEDSPKSNLIQAPSISLPKGGGAIKSIDEKFSVNAVNGTAGFSIPLPFSSARGFSPAVSLSYSSGSGNGVFGLGWSTDIPSIKRKTANELPLYFDAIDSDTYIFSGAEDLVPEFAKDAVTGLFTQDQYGNYAKNDLPSTDGLFTIRTYRPRIEGAFARIERWTELSTAIIHWRIISKDNSTSLLGIRPQSRLADPNAPLKVFEWLLDFSFDDKGNCAAYQYQKEDTTGLDPGKMYNKNRINGNAPFANSYISSIAYGNTMPYMSNGSELYSGSESAQYNDGSFTIPGAFMFETIFDYSQAMPVDFDYNNQAPDNFLYNDSLPWIFRSDPFSQYLAGFEIRTCRLCQRVLLYHYFNELPGGSALVRSMDFEYTNNGSQGFTFLSQVRLNGFTKQNNNNDTTTYTSKSFPPYDFAYQQMAWNTNIQAVPTASLENAPAGIDEKLYKFTDLYSEGLSGILTEQGGGLYYKSNLQNGVFTPARLVSPKPSFSGLGKDLQLMDLEGNGRKQLVKWQGEPRGFFELDDDEDWQPFHLFRQLPNINFSDPNTRFLDLDGDGRSDILITDDEVFTWYCSDGKAGFEPAKKLARNYDEEKGPAIVFAEPLQTIFMADMSGDGKTDIVRIRNGEICYWPNLGYGKFGAKVSMDGAPVFDHPDNFNPAYIRLADIDGSGTADVIYLGRNNFTVWLNLNGNCFSAPNTIPTFPGINNLTTVSVFDLLGTGLGCLVWNSSLPGDAAAPLRYIDLMKSTKPHIMISYKNNMGKEVELEYTPSTRFYIQDKLAGTPWVTRLHFVAYCVSKVSVYDRIMKTRLASTYSYHHGYYDHYEKEFRGFGRVDQTDCEEIDNFILNSPGAANNITEQDINQSPVVTKTWFHTGAFLSQENILSQFSHEYFPNPTIENVLPEPELPAGLTIDDWREALRSCKGTTLRKEVYGQDNSLLQTIPYIAEQHNSLIKILQPRGQNKYSVCLVHESESITYQYERDAADPRIAHEMIFEVDDYANVLSSASIVYPRIGVPDAVDPLIQSEQQKIHILFHSFAYTNPILPVPASPDSYRTPLIYSAKSYEVTALPDSNTLQTFTPSLLVAYYNLDELSTYCTAAFPATGNSSPSGTLFEYSRTLYCSDTDFTAPLAPGVMDTKALVYDKYKAAFTQAMLSALNVPGFNLANIDAMLQAPSDGAFVYDENYYWISAGQQNYDPAHFYLSTAYTDPFGNITTIAYDDNYLFVQSSTDGLQNTITVFGYNYRTLSPYLLTDINGNRSGVRFDELAMVATAFVMGKTGENKGDLLDTTQTEASPLDQPTIISAYSVTEWFNQSNTPGFNVNAYYKPQPNYVYVQARTTHYYADDGTVNTAPVAWQQMYAYSDGGGHEVVKKVQAEPGSALAVDPDGSVVTIKDSPRWIGNGRTILNNKGNPVKKYEPYFSATHGFDDEKDMVELGVTAILTYDAPSRVIRTDFPDETFSMVEFDPWKQGTYDQNDTVIDSQWFKSINPDLTQPEPSDPLARAAWCAAQDYNTPTVTFFDTLGRTIVIQQLLTPSLGVISKSILDIQGNALQVIDANKNTVMIYQYDLLKTPLYQDSMDAGERWMLNNIIAKPLMKWDQRNQIFTFSYDALLRPLTSLVTGGDGSVPLNSIYEKIIYGEVYAQTAGITTAQASNLLGKPYIQYDQAGAVTSNGFDFKGNLLSSTREFTIDYKNLPDWANPSPGALLNTTVNYTSLMVYDALNRVTSTTTPDGSITLHTFNLTGLLQRVTVTQQGGPAQPFVQNIDYDAKGQRNSILYGNNALTSYGYDPDTFRLISLITNNAGNTPVQELSYIYDPVGNIMQVADACIPTVFFNNYEVTGVSLYEYDPLYRLVSASGREHAGQANFGATDNWNDAQFMATYSPNDNLAWQIYTQNYAYDAVGNISQIAHTVGGGTGWTRNYTYETGNNRLTSTTVGANNYPYTYHPQHGFITSMLHLQVMTWDFKDQLQAVAAQKVNTGTPETTWYVYDGAGQRVRKITENSAANGQTPTQKCERVYVGGIEIYTEYTGANAGLVRQTLQVMDDKQRIAMIETRNNIDDGTAPVLVRYQVANHLGSSCLELDDAANIISYEEYHPYGTTSYQAMNAALLAAAKRYRYTGMERDEESGFSYHHARYYAPWLGRWTAPDPSGIKDSSNVYAYVTNNPILYFDSNGKEKTLANRAWGGVQMLSGAVQAGLGGAVFIQIEVPVAAQVVGGIALAHGTDDFLTGWKQMVTGEKETNATTKIATATARAAGASEATATAVGTGVNLGLGMVSPGGGITQLPGAALATTSTGEKVLVATQVAVDTRPLVGVSQTMHLAVAAGNGPNGGNSSDSGGSNGQSGSSQEKVTKQFSGDKVKFTVSGTAQDFSAVKGTGVYVLKDASGNVLYVGEGDVFTRLRAHITDPEKTQWFGEIAKIEVRGVELTKKESLALEEDLIHELAPLYNKELMPFEAAYPGQLRGADIPRAQRPLTFDVEMGNN